MREPVIDYKHAINTHPSVRKLIRCALEEDIGPGDVTTDALVDPGQTGIGTIITREPMIVAGVGLSGEVFLLLDPEVEVQPYYRDGQRVARGERVVAFEGSLAALLKGERTALNFMQRLSGIATRVRSFVDSLEGVPVRIMDTRKTTPGLRVLEKYAVRMGGASNHRMGLYDGILIKDNHIQACGGVGPAIERMKQKATHLMKIEIETSDIEQVKAAVAAGADVIMLDNMDISEIKAAVNLIDGAALVEVSGNVSMSDLKDLADLRVDIVSIGALTHSAKSVDLSMDIKPTV